MVDVESGGSGASTEPPENQAPSTTYSRRGPDGVQHCRKDARFLKD